jgi:hypothetical protein
LDAPLTAFNAPSTAAKADLLMEHHERRRYRMDLKLFRLLRQFSRDSVKSKPFDLETVGLAYMRRAYELGRDAGLAEADRLDPTRIVSGNRTDTENGGDSGPEM